ncbi:MAG: hypothetical protein AAFU79_23510, partial [Myxococcota bacterium]
CDGTVDEDAVPAAEGCLDSAGCGGFVCTAPVDGATTVCGPSNPSAALPFAPCSAGADCDNDLCVAGLCSPMCRFGTDTCRGVQVEGRERRTECARHVAAEPRPEHNSCQIECSQERCPAGSTCVWRDVLGTLDDQHLFVCSELDAQLLPLGAACPSNSTEDDLKCQHGLCFGFTCTRRCGGPGADCSDVGPGFSCIETTLIYGLREFQASICRDLGGGS